VHVAKVERACPEAIYEGSNKNRIFIAFAIELNSGMEASLPTSCSFFLRREFAEAGMNQKWARCGR
jgi:hypothetical protein